MTGQLHLFEPRPLAASPPIASRTDPATSHEAARKVEPRRGGQMAAILERLRGGPATNVELALISLKYTSRISDLRAAGHDVVCERQGADGVCVYRLGGA